jgi:hypothetical protein
MQAGELWAGSVIERRTDQEREDRDEPAGEETFTIWKYARATGGSSKMGRRRMDKDRRA